MLLRHDDDTTVSLENGVVVKTVYRPKSSGLKRRHPRIVVDRETEALQILDGIDGVPRFLDRVSDITFAMEYIPGLGISICSGLPKDYFQRLLETVRLCEERGVYRVGVKKEDFLLIPEGQPAIVDFGNIIFRDDALVDLPGILKLAQLYPRLRIWDMERRYGTSERKPIYNQIE